MDLVLVMKQRLRDQNSEVRALTRTFLYMTAVATVLLLIAAYSYAHLTSRISVPSVLLALIVAYALMGTALHLLQKNRFVVVPFHSGMYGNGGAGAGTFWLNPVVYPYAFYALIVATLSVVFLQGAFLWFTCALLVHFAVFVQYAYLLWRSMSR